MSLSDPDWIVDCLEPALLQVVWTLVLGKV